MTRIPHPVVLRTLFCLLGASVLLALRLPPALSEGAPPPEPIGNSPAAAQVEALVKELQDRLKQGWDAGLAQWEAKNDVEKAVDILKVERSPLSKVAPPTEEEAKEIIAAAKADKMKLKWEFVEAQVVWRSSKVSVPELIFEFVPKLAALGEPAIPAILKIAHANEASGVPGTKVSETSGIVCMVVIDALGKLPNAEDALLELANSETQWVRSNAMLGLCGRSGDRAVRRAIEMLKSPDTQDRTAACWFFGRLPNGYEDDADKKQQVLNALLSARDDPDRKVRRLAVYYLWRFGGEAELPFLEKLATSDEILVKKNDADKGEYPVRQAANAAIVGILARSPSREEGVKPIPPAPLFSLHLMRQKNEEPPGRKWLEVRNNRIGANEEVDPLPIVTERSVASVEEYPNENDGTWWLGLTLTRPGAVCLTRYCLSHLVVKLAILIEGDEVGDVYLLEPKALDQISIYFLTKERADEIAAKLNAAIQARATQPEPAPAAP